jgi:hypothetical protein
MKSTMDFEELALDMPEQVTDQLERVCNGPASAPVTTEIQSGKDNAGRLVGSY